MPEEIVGRTFTSMMPPGAPARRFAEICGKLFAGQPVRDEVLKAAAQAFKQCIAGGDVLVRWGGDEDFVPLSHPQRRGNRRIHTGGAA